LQTRRAINRHLDESLESKSRAAIFTTSGRMLADFTDDREKLRQAVDSILPWTNGPDPQQDCVVGYYMADYLTNQTLYFSGFLFTDEQISALVANHTDYILTAVAEEELGCLRATLPHGIAQVRALVHQALERGSNETAYSLGAVKDGIRRLSAMPGSRTIVLASPGFIMGRDFRTAENDVLDQALRANVTVNTIDMRGLYTMPGWIGDAGQKGQQSSPFASAIYGQAAIAEASQAGNILEELADGTGGTFFHNDNGLKEGLNLLAARPEYIYVLGFSPRDLKYDGSYHTLESQSREPAQRVQCHLAGAQRLLGSESRD